MYHVVYGPDLDHLFGALADATRREIVELLLARGELSVGEVAAPFAISAPAVSRHLQVLENAGLIERRVERQWRLVRVRADALKPIEAWLTRQNRYGRRRSTGWRRWRPSKPETEEVMSDPDATGTTLRLERFIASSPEDLFALWVEPEQVARWWSA